jgi:hypothetical protein
LVDQIKKNAMRGAHVGQGVAHTWFWWENLRERDHLEDPDIGGRIILKWICKKWDGGKGMDLIDLAQNRDRWQIFVNLVMCLWVT